MADRATCGELEAGAVGFVVKDAPAEVLADTIRRVMAGERVIDPALAASTLAAGESPLTARECDVLTVARSGASVAEMAAELYLSEGRFATTCRRPSPRPRPATGWRIVVTGS